MSHAIQTDPREAAVWFANGVPVRLVYRGARYRVNDTPKPLSPADILGHMWHPAITHPPKEWHGWRFHALDEDGRTRMFDIRHFETAPHWIVLKVYE
jgi:hypothetical protein